MYHPTSFPLSPPRKNTSLYDQYKNTQNDTDQDEEYKGYYAGYVNRLWLDHIIRSILNYLVLQTIYQSVVDKFLQAFKIISSFLEQ